MTHSNIITSISVITAILLVGSISNSYAEVGDFIFEFDGTDGNGTPFEIPNVIVTDSNDRILVNDVILDIIQIFDHNGIFINELALDKPSAIATDRNDRILVIDSASGRVEVYNPEGDFTFSFDGSDDDGTPFDVPVSITTDSNNRIIVSDFNLKLVQVFDDSGSFLFDIDVSEETGFNVVSAMATDSNDRILLLDSGNKLVTIFDSKGEYVTEFDGSNGGTKFGFPTGVAVDKNDNILVTDMDLFTVQIFDPNGLFIAEFNGSDGGTVFQLPISITVDKNDRIIVLDSVLGTVQVFEGIKVELPVKKSGNGGCADCVAPTLGLNSFYVRVVDDGFSYNGNTVQVEKWHTPFPLINATVGEINTVEIIVYENQGVNNMKLVQFGLGAKSIGEPLNDLEVLIEVNLDINSNQFLVDEIIINDKDNLIENSTVGAVIDLVKCSTDSQNETCLKVTLQYSYREPTLYNIMVVNARDKPGNSQNFYFNEGVEVFGESLNEPPTYVIQNRKTHQQTEDLTLTLTRTDKVNHIWIDQLGIEYLQVSSDRFDRITPAEPYKCTDPPLTANSDRQNCHFRELTSLWTYKSK